MGDLYNALAETSDIRRQMARSTQFRGYGPATLAGTGFAAIVASVGQAFWVPDPVTHLQTYLCLWIGTAVLCSIVAGVQIYTRTRRLHSGLSNEMLRTAVEQFLPAVGAGMVVTGILVRSVPSVLWMLPGLWQVIYSLGVFSSCRFLPRPTVAAGGWYLLTGLVCLAPGDFRSLAPWTMGLAFWAGQLLVAGILLVAAPEHEDEA
jgi:hypothetical protein